MRTTINETYKDIILKILLSIFDHFRSIKKLLIKIKNLVNEFSKKFVYKRKNEKRIKIKRRAYCSSLFKLKRGGIKFMPMIIKNGKRYCSTGGDADNVYYNNENSGLEATNTQGAIDELATSVTELNSNIVFGVGNTKIELPKTTTSYTATENCYLNVFGQSSNTSHCYIDITLDNGYKARQQVLGAAALSLPVSCPIRKGQTATITMGNATVNNIYMFTD